jgi:hypothetical protein
LEEDDETYGMCCSTRAAAVCNCKGLKCEGRKMGKYLSGKMEPHGCKFKRTLHASLMVLTPVVEKVNPFPNANAHAMHVFGEENSHQ